MFHSVPDGGTEEGLSALVDITCAEQAFLIWHQLDWAESLDPFNSDTL